MTARLLQGKEVHPLGHAQMIVCEVVTKNPKIKLTDEISIVPCAVKCGRFIYIHTSMMYGVPKVCTCCATWLTDCQGNA